MSYNLGHILRLGSCLGGPSACSLQVLGTSSGRLAGSKSSQLVQNEFCKDTKLALLCQGAFCSAQFPGDSML